MSEFQQFWWYIGVLMTSIGLIVSVISSNWVLAIVCAFATGILSKLNSKVALPKVYTERGIKNEWFTPGRKNK